MRSRLVTSALFACLAAPLAAQQGSTNPAVAQAMSASASKYVPPACSADKNLHFKVGSGRTYLKSAIETPDPEKRKSLLAQGERVILEAMKDNGQDKSAGAWYFLGRIRLHEGDVAGADSSLVRALALAPDCQAEVANLRRPIFASLFNPGVDAYNAGKTDTAMALFHLAAKANPDAIQPPFFIATVLYNNKQYDSAAVYYKTALATPVEPKEAALRNKATFFYGLTLLQLQKPKDAIVPLREYAAAAPDDPDAKKALYNAYTAAGMSDSAAVLQKEILASGGGESAAAGGGQGSAAAGGTNDALTIGNNLYREKKYADALAAFEKVLAAEPNNRDALYWGGFSALASEQGAKLLDFGKRLKALEPYNEDARKMVGQGYELTKNETARQSAAIELMGMPVKVDVATWAVKGDDASLAGTATGRRASTKTGKVIPPAPMTLVFELLDAKGAVVGTKEVQLPALTAGQSQEIKIDAAAPGAVAFRYKKKV